jgi:hypothetical protein
MGAGRHLLGWCWVLGCASRPAATLPAPRQVAATERPATPEPSAAAVPSSSSAPRAPTSAAHRRGPPAASAFSVDLQGYVGPHPIRATLDVTGGAAWPEHVGEAWDGTYGYFGKAQSLRLVGRSTSEPEPTLSGAPRESFPCAFEELAGTTLTGRVEAECETARNELRIRGTWTNASASSELPFFLGSVRVGVAYEAFYGAALKTPGKSHGCAPYVRIQDGVAAPQEREMVAYSLSWPCEDTGQASAFLALSDLGRPGKFATAPAYFGEISQDADWRVLPLDEVWKDAALYELVAQSTNEPGPDAVRAGWSSNETRRWLVPVSDEAVVGPAVALPVTLGASGLGGCANQSTTIDLHALELDGQPPEELLVTVTEAGEEAAPATGDAWFRCVSSPVRTTRRAYRLARRGKTVSLASMPLPGDLESALRGARAIGGGG